jgi:hypothetical protein
MSAFMSGQINSCFLSGPLSAGHVFSKSAFRAKARNIVSKVNELKEGAFGPLSQQPLVKATLPPLGRICVAVLTDVLEQLIKSGTVSVRSARLMLERSFSASRRTYVREGSIITGVAGTVKHPVSQVA